jgi:predicted transcriptional regulator
MFSILNKSAKFASTINMGAFKSVLQPRHLSSTLNSSTTAMNVYKKSCYFKIDFKINEEMPVTEAVTRFSAFNIGCLAVTDKEEKVVGVFSERDLITKVCAQNKPLDYVKIKDVCTYSPNIIIAKKDDSLELCMSKMMFKDIRHLLVIDDKNEEFIGMISIKDLIKEIIKNKTDIITRLSDFKIGKGAYFGSE